jgi:signal transduction histidine kinase
MVEERTLDFVAYLTWLIIGIPSVVWEVQRHTLGTPRALGWAACFIAFIVLFAFHDHARPFNIMAQSVVALACFVLHPVDFQPVLLVIVAGELGAVVLPVAMSVIAVQTIALYAIVYRSDGAFLLASAYLAFESFSLTMARIANKEMCARKALAEANAELRVATGLLEMNSRTAERLRIARDLHDLIGHHLAALSINLEVARHLTEGDAREQVERSQAVTKLLLSDVRDVVGRMREDEPLDLSAAVKSLGEVIQRPLLHLDLSQDLAVKDAALAQVALRAVQEIVTNSVRHSGARNLWLKMAMNEQTLAIEARDDGVGTDVVRFGNGLSGMRERVEEARGSIEVASVRGRGFEVRVSLPLTGEAA